MVSRAVPRKIAKVLWLGGDKKGGYSKLDRPFARCGEPLEIWSWTMSLIVMIIQGPELHWSLCLTLWRSVVVLAQFPRHLLGRDTN